MSVTNEPAPHAKPWDVEWQQFLARQQNNASLTQIIGDGSNLEGDLTTVEGVVAALVVAVGKLNTVVNTTSESSDYALSVGETAQIDITTASTALNIAVENGVYEITIVFDSGTFAADRDITLEVNNTTYAGEFLRIGFSADTAIATDEVDTADVDASAFELAITARPRYIRARIIIDGDFSAMEVVSYGITAGSRRIRLNTAWRDGSVAHTSLGTLNIVEAATGTAYVTRMA